MLHDVEVRHDPYALVIYCGFPSMFVIPEYTHAQMRPEGGNNVNFASVYLCKKTHKAHSGFRFGSLYLDGTGSNARYPGL